jgi:hypothetical protein
LFLDGLLLSAWFGKRDEADPFQFSVRRSLTASADFETVNKPCPNFRSWPRLCKNAFKVFGAISSGSGYAQHAPIFEVKQFVGAVPFHRRFWLGGLRITQSLR